MKWSINYLNLILYNNIKEESEVQYTILADRGCANQRESTNGSLNYEGVPTDGWSQFYVGDIEIIFENVTPS